MRLRPRRIELGAAAPFQQGDGQVQGLPLILGILARHRKPVLRPPQDKIVARHLGQQAHNGISEIGLGGPDVGCTRFDGASHPPEEVQLPTRIESDVVQFDVAIGARPRLGHTQALARVRALRGYRGVAIEGCLRDQGPGLADPSCGHP